jgi:hypothetical protein
VIIKSEQTSKEKKLKSVKILLNIKRFTPEKSENRRSLKSIRMIISKKPNTGQKALHGKLRKEKMNLFLQRKVINLRL